MLKRTRFRALSECVTRGNEWELRAAGRGSDLGGSSHPQFAPIKRNNSSSCNSAPRGNEEKLETINAEHILQQGRLPDDHKASFPFAFPSALPVKSTTNRPLKG